MTWAVCDPGRDSLPRAESGLPGYAGAPLIGDGRMALILDVDGLRAKARQGSCRSALGRDAFHL